MALILKNKTRARRSEKRRKGYGKNLRVSPCKKNDWVFSVSGGRFFNRGNFTLLHLTGYCDCLHLKDGYPPGPMQVVAFPFLNLFKTNVSVRSANEAVKKRMQGKRHIFLNSYF